MFTERRTIHTYMMMIHVFEDDWRHQGTIYRNTLGLGPGLFLAHMPFVSALAERPATIWTLDPTSVLDSVYETGVGMHHGLVLF